MQQPETSELDKQAEIIKAGKAMLIKEFYDWIHEKGWQICRPVEHSRQGYYEPIIIQPEQLMADFFGIDRNKIEEERRALLEYIREQQDA